MITLLSILIFAVIGVIAGFASGLLGVGGGFIVVPALQATFALMGFPSDTIMQTAIGTSLAAMICTAGASAWAHYKQKGIYWDYFKFMIPGIFIGCIVGSYIAEKLTSDQLKQVFGALMCLTGFYLLLTASKDQSGKNGLNPNGLLLMVVGLFIGSVSSLLGMGGGIITVPILSFLGAPVKNAISTSAVTGFLIAVVGALSYLFLGMFHDHPNDSAGYLYLPAFLIIGLMAAFMAPIGAKYAHNTHETLLKAAFGLLQLCIGIIMLS